MKPESKIISIDTETAGLSGNSSGRVYDKNLLENLRNKIESLGNSCDASDAFAGSLDHVDNCSLKYDPGISLYHDPTESIPIDIAQDYRHIISEENYWKNKQNDISEAIRILLAYNIDIDYNEAILRAREAGRYRDNYSNVARELEENYPGIRLTLDRVFKKEDEIHDPILDRKWSQLEHRRNSDTYSDLLKFLGSQNTGNNASSANSLKRFMSTTSGKIYPIPSVLHA